MLLVIEVLNGNVVYFFKSQFKPHEFDRTLEFFRISRIWAKVCYENKNSNFKNVALHNCAAVFVVFNFTIDK